MHLSINNDKYNEHIIINMLSFIVQIDSQITARLIQNVERLDESIKEEAEGVHNSLGLFPFCLCFVNLM